MTGWNFLLLLALGVPLLLVFGYYFFRLASSAIFKSWKEHFHVAAKENDE